MYLVKLRKEIVVSFFADIANSVNAFLKKKFDFYFPDHIIKTMKSKQLFFFGLTLISFGSILIFFHLLQCKPLIIEFPKESSHSVGFFLGRFLGYYINLILGVIGIVSGTKIMIRNTSINQA